VDAGAKPWKDIEAALVWRLEDNEPWVTKLEEDVSVLMERQGITHGEGA